MTPERSEELDERVPSWYRQPDNAVAKEAESEAINALRAKYTDYGWLSTLVWNTRNNYLAWPDSKIDATAVRMIVEGFLAEIQELKRDSDA